MEGGVPANFKEFHTFVVGAHCCHGLYLLLILYMAADHPEVSFHKYYTYSGFCQMWVLRPSVLTMASETL